MSALFNQNNQNHETFGLSAFGKSEMSPKKKG